MIRVLIARGALARQLAHVALWMACAAGPAVAQGTGTLAGRITTDSGGRPIRGAGIRIPQLVWIGQTDTTGAFVVEKLPPGTYVIIAEARGFRAQRAEVTLAAGVTTTRDFALVESAHVLATVDVRAKAPPRVSPKMVDFERRRLRGAGRYVTREALARVPGRQLEEVLRSGAPGVHFIKSPDGQTWLISARHAATNYALLTATDRENMPNTICHAQVVLDGAVVSSSTAPQQPRLLGTGDGSWRTGTSNPRTQTRGGADPIDLNQFFGDQLEGVEYYPDATTTPIQYRTPAAVCGTLILWTRDK